MDTSGHRHQKRQGVEVKIQVRHQEELPQPARPREGRRAIEGDGRLKDCTPGLERRDVTMWRAAIGSPNPRFGGEEGGGSSLGTGEMPGAKLSVCGGTSLAKDTIFSPSQPSPGP